MTTRQPEPGLVLVTGRGAAKVADAAMADATRRGELVLLVSADALDSARMLRRAGAVMANLRAPETLRTWHPEFLPKGAPDLAATLRRTGARYVYVDDLAAAVDGTDFDPVRVTAVRRLAEIAQEAGAVVVALAARPHAVLTTHSRAVLDLNIERARNRRHDMSNKVRNGTCDQCGQFAPLVCNYKCPDGVLLLCEWCGFIARLNELLKASGLHSEYDGEDAA